MGGADTIVSRASDRCNIIIKHRHAIYLEGIPPIDGSQNMRGKVQRILMLLEKS